MTLAHEALSIVIREHQGKLGSFHADAMGRLMTADRVERRMRATFRQLGFGPNREADVLQLKHRVIGRWRALVPEYVPLEMQKATSNTENLARTTKVIWAFRKAICDRLRASIFERLGQAQRLVNAYYDGIIDGFPRGMHPPTAILQRMNYLHTPDEVRTLGPLRLTLVKNIQWIAPEMGNALQEVTLDNCGRMLIEFVGKLNARTRDVEDSYGDVLMGRQLNCIWANRLNNEHSGNTPMDEEAEEEGVQTGDSSDGMDEPEDSDTEDLRYINTYRQDATTYH